MRDKRTASEKEEPNMSSQAIEAIMELPVSVPDMKPGPWNVDTAHSSLEFTAKHMVFTTVHGRFDEFDATVVVDPEPSKSHVEVTIKADSISTGNPDRDTHLKSPDFLDVESYPELTFKSTALDDINPEAGTFTLKGGSPSSTKPCRSRSTSSSTASWTRTCGATREPHSRPRAASAARTGA